MITEVESVRLRSCGQSCENHPTPSPSDRNLSNQKTVLDVSRYSERISWKSGWHINALCLSQGWARSEKGAGFRGGNWNNDAMNLYVSDRNNAGNTNANRNNNNGWRGVRVAP
ncbi:hypothetical protein FJZ31_13180 [Candidatus Poribacteria bacterium]|nr:hypothetical protein [Candidatus Poribacteria bacterium]